MLILGPITNFVILKPIYFLLFAQNPISSLTVSLYFLGVLTMFMFTYQILNEVFFSYFLTWSITYHDILFFAHLTYSIHSKVLTAYFHLYYFIIQVQMTHIPHVARRCFSGFRDDEYSCSKNILLCLCSDIPLCQF